MSSSDSHLGQLIGYVFPIIVVSLLVHRSALTSLTISQERNPIGSPKFLIKLSLRAFPSNPGRSLKCIYLGFLQSIRLRHYPQAGHLRCSVSGPHQIHTFALRLIDLFIGALNVELPHSSTRCST